MDFYKPGELRPPRTSDFEYFRRLSTNHDGWKRKYHKHDISVYTRSTEVSDFKMIKVVATLHNVSADVMYDTLHDPDYRKLWDKVMLDQEDICQVSSCSDVGYYALKSPMTFANRDFVLQRVWEVTEKDFIIFNHTVYHKKCAQRKGFVRAINYLTGYLITPINENNCHLIYVTQNDPRGRIPRWAMNIGTTVLAPRIMKGVHKAAMEYPAWKATHQPQFKPWRNPEQQKCLLPILDPADVLSEPDYTKTQVDESHINEQSALQDIGNDPSNGSPSAECT